MGKLYFLTGDIIENSKNMDAIVNAQNKYMLNGSGICGAVYRGAGVELLDYCKKEYPIPMEPCEVRITPGFKLNMDIIHSYAPIFREWDNPIEKLLEAYKNILVEIKNKEYVKVIIPSLGTGIHGYKHEDVALHIVNLLYDFCSNNNIEIYFINRFSIATNEYVYQLKNSKKMSDKEIIKVLVNENECYDEFIDGKDIEEMNYYEKMIYKKITGEKL